MVEIQDFANFSFPRQVELREAGIFSVRRSFSEGGSIFFS
jgi:hypothetical protein